MTNMTNTADTIFRAEEALRELRPKRSLDIIEKALADMKAVTPEDVHTVTYLHHLRLESLIVFGRYDLATQAKQMFYEMIQTIRADDTQSPLRTLMEIFIQVSSNRNPNESPISNEGFEFMVTQAREVADGLTRQQKFFLANEIVTVLTRRQQPVEQTMETIEGFVHPDDFELLHLRARMIDATQRRDDEATFVVWDEFQTQDMQGRWAAHDKARFLPNMVLHADEKAMPLQVAVGLYYTLADTYDLLEKERDQEDAAVIAVTRYNVLARAMMRVNESYGTEAQAADERYDRDRVLQLTDAAIPMFADIVHRAVQVSEYPMWYQVPDGLRTFVAHSAQQAINAAYEHGQVLRRQGRTFPPEIDGILTDGEMLASKVQYRPLHELLSTIRATESVD